MAVDRNPLHEDFVLFNMYMTALDHVLSRAEIKDAMEDFGLRGSTLRVMLLADARRILSLAPREFAAYQAELVHRQDIGCDGTDLRHRVDEFGELTWLGRGIAAAGAAMIVCGLVTRWLWDWSWILFWAGGSALLVAATMWLISLLSRRSEGRFFQENLFSEMSADLVRARDRLIVAVSGVELLAQVRTLINTMRTDRFDHAFLVTSSPGLSEVYDSTYNVPTRTVHEVKALLDGVSGMSLGIAGPRGSGKSTIVRQYCGPAPRPPRPGSGGEGFGRSRFREIRPPDDSAGDLRCMVSAPVDYAARDFVLHLFATFCRSVIARLSSRHGAEYVFFRRIFWARRVWRILVELSRRVALYGIVIFGLLAWAGSVSAFLGVPREGITAVAVLAGAFGLLRFSNWLTGSIRRWRKAVANGPAPSIVAAAKRHLLKVRFLQSRNLGWSGGLKLPIGVDGQVSASVTHDEQPLSYPELVEHFRSFTRRVAEFVHARGDNVFIGVDELDKIGSADQAERFLNEIKGIFGVPHVYFMISVSDDALMAFERRGIPLRDAFDSSFDEIVRVGLLSYVESRRLLYRRVIGLSEPYVALCHAMSGGLARDLIRSARQLVRIDQSLVMARDTDEEQIQEGIEADRYLLLAEGDGMPEITRAPSALASLCTALVQEELARKARAIAHALGGASLGRVEGFHQILYDVGYGDSAAKSPMEILDILAEGGTDESPDVGRLRLDFTAYAYFCATLREVFDESLDGSRITRCTNNADWPGSFDALASARHAFVMDARIAWRAVTRFRLSWNLEVREFD
ncbi:hypothetical protein [Streptosporangium sp. H16]|uniref:hypothetical protein n=1 Tax=Streptosporangium sp. H16 TaxID=3444184 RepID=UPI003F78E094